MVYGSFEDVPGGHGRQTREVESSDVERARLDVFRAAEKCGLSLEETDDAAELTKVCRHIATYRFSMGGAWWDSQHAALQRAWDALEAVDDEAERIGTQCAEVPF
jgi:hypothetical protein